jgi:hypothetical protein
MPEIPVGDVVRSLKLPGWLRWVMNAVKGLRITRGGTTIVLNEGHGATPPRTGLDRPAKVEPPKTGGRWPL